MLLHVYSVNAVIASFSVENSYYLSLQDSVTLWRTHSGRMNRDFTLPAPDSVTMHASSLPLLPTYRAALRQTLRPVFR